MTGTEMVTELKLERSSVRELMDAVNAHCKSLGIEAEESDFRQSVCLGYNDDNPLPNSKDYRWLIAFAVEGNSEGYYVHIGSMGRGDYPNGSGRTTSSYQDLGVAKTYSANNAYALAREAQRFLTAAAWN